MTYLEAIKSGKNFRRSVEEEWLYYYDKVRYVVSDTPRGVYLSDIEATDWEVEIKAVSLTEKDFDTALDTATKAWLSSSSETMTLINLLKKELFK